MADKYDPLKRVKVSESKGQGGASPGQLYKKVPLYKQLNLFDLQVKRLEKKKKATNNVNTV